MFQLLSTIPISAVFLHPTEYDVKYSRVIRLSGQLLFKTSLEE